MQSTKCTDDSCREASMVFEVNKKMVFLCFVISFLVMDRSMTVSAETFSDEVSQVDVDALQEELEELEQEYAYPDFSDIYAAIMEFRFFDVFEEIIQWIMQTLTFELSSSWTLMGQLVGVILFSAFFSNISDAFPQFAVSDSGFLISYFIIFTILFSDFTIMTNVYQNMVETLSGLLKIVIPVFALTVTISGNLSTGVVCYEYFMVLVLVINHICLTIVLPTIRYYLLLELLNHFSTAQRISRLCESIYLLLSRGMKVLFTIFFGLHLLETMVVPSFDTTKNAVVNRILGMIPGAGTIAQTVTGTVVGSAVLIKNSMGVSAIIFILLLLLIPIIKLLLYCLVYLLLSILLETLAYERFTGCVTAVQKSGILLVYALCFAGALFILTIAVTAFATNS
ncbi:MAG: stage III sporulation protein AE [Clostridiales bacterium]|nr:stage III sporulation protein AE [Clostridiales bacterium]